MIKVFVIMSFFNWLPGKKARTSLVTKMNIIIKNVYVDENTLRFMLFEDV